MNLLTFLPKRKHPVPGFAETLFSCLESAIETKVKTTFFPPDRYKLVERTAISTGLHDDRQACTNPAFKFIDQQTGKSFWLEVKTCSQDWSSHIHWCTEMQLRRYVSCHKKTPTFLLLDIQNDSKSSYCLLSMTQARYAHLLYSCVSHFEIAGNQFISSAQLWSR